ncbi:MAG: hypothetical protein ACRETA_04395 [Gammaproteobacteria bacterium]
MKLLERIFAWQMKKVHKVSPPLEEEVEKMIKKLAAKTAHDIVAESEATDGELFLELPEEKDA